MENEKKQKIPRRSFLFSITGLVAGSTLLTPSILNGMDEKEWIPKTKLSPEELKYIEKSKMAKDLKKYFGKGYSCAESILMLALNYLDLPQKLVWAAGGFGGGLYHRDLCGYLTGGIMGIGFACSKLKIERKRAKKILGEAVKKYWAWWKTEAPLRCLEIRKPKSDKNICVRLGYIAAAKVEELIKVIQAQA